MDKGSTKFDFNAALVEIRRSWPGARVKQALGKEKNMRTAGLRPLSTQPCQYLVGPGSNGQVRGPASGSKNQKPLYSSSGQEGVCRDPPKQGLAGLCWRRAAGGPFHVGRQSRSSHNQVPAKPCSDGFLPKGFCQNLFWPTLTGMSHGRAEVQSKWHWQQRA